MLQAGCQKWTYSDRQTSPLKKSFCSACPQGQGKQGGAYAVATNGSKGRALPCSNNGRMVTHTIDSPLLALCLLWVMGTWYAKTPDEPHSTAVLTAGRWTWFEESAKQTFIQAHA